MLKKPLKRAVGRPPSSEAEEVTDGILVAAARSFVAYGFSETTMRAIASEAGVSPQTLYARFPDKTELYEALMSSRTEKLLTVMSSVLTDDALPAKALQQFGERLISTFIGSDLQRLHQRVIESAGKFPRLANVFYDQGPNRGRMLLEVYLRKQVRSGSLHIDQIEIAAEQFIGALVGGVVIRSTLGQEQKIRLKADMDAWVRQAVYVFMQAYGRES